MLDVYSDWKKCVEISYLAYNIVQEYLVYFVVRVSVEFHTSICSACSVFEVQNWTVYRVIGIITQ